MRAAALVLPCVLVGCLEPPDYACNSDSVCVLNNVQGVCDIPTSTCVYPGPECPSMLRDGHGNCVDTVGVASTEDPTVDPSATDSMSSSPATTEPEETSTSESETTTDVSGPQTSTTVAAQCEADGMDITGLGVVGASTVFDGYPPILSADGDVSTSWFSEGPEMGPTVYSWTLSNEHCIARVELTGNELHSNPAFREDFGFGAVTVKVLDGDSIVLMETHPLDGTPDPEIVVETGGVRATRLLLEFTGHENPDCGGFSELRVTGE